MMQISHQFNLRRWNVEHLHSHLFLWRTTSTVSAKLSTSIPLLLSMITYDNLLLFPNFHINKLQVTGFPKLYCTCSQQNLHYLTLNYSICSTCMSSLISLSCSHKWFNLLHFQQYDPWHRPYSILQNSFKSQRYANSPKTPLHFDRIIFYFLFSLNITLSIYPSVGTRSKMTYTSHYGASKPSTKHLKSSSPSKLSKNIPS